jgi:hypothetical protein
LLAIPFIEIEAGILTVRLIGVSQGLLDDIALCDMASMRHDRERDRVVTLVCFGIGRGRSADQRESERLAQSLDELYLMYSPHSVSLYCIAVLVPASDRYTIARLTEIGETMSANLKLGLVDGGVPVRRALNHPELSAVGRVSRVDVQGKVSAMPVRRW